MHVARGVRPQLSSLQLHRPHWCTTHHLTNMPAHMHTHWHSVRQQHTNGIVRAFIAGPHLVSLNAHLSTRSIHSAVWSASGVYVCISVPPLVCGWCHRRHPSSSSMMRAIMSHAAHTGPPRRSCTSRGCTPPSIRRSGRPRRSVGRPRFTHHSSCPVIAVTRRVGRCRQLSTLELGGTHPPSLILRRAGRGPPRFHPRGGKGILAASSGSGRWLGGSSPCGGSRALAPLGLALEGTKPALDHQVQVLDCELREPQAP